MLKEFFRDKSAAQLLMIAATLVLLISQFFYYFEDTGGGFLLPGSETRASVLYLDFSARGTATGWDVHPHAYIILLVLGFALLRDDVAGERWFGRFGYWVCFILIVAATIPGAPGRAKGAGLGALACVMALAATILNHVSSKKSGAAAGNG